MKKIRYELLSVFIILSVTFWSCELLTSKNDCDATKMESTEEPVVYIRAQPKLDLKLGDQYVLYSDRITISGSIRKIYCSGKESGYFTFNPTFFVDPKMTTDDFWLPQPYQYKFDNTKDKLVVICHAKVYFDNGKIYESSEYTGEYFFKDIKLDINRLKYYIDVMLASNLEWYEVTSK